MSDKYDAFTKEGIIEILEENQADIEAGNWEKVYETIDYLCRGHFSDFLIKNGIDPNTLFKNYIPYHAFRTSKLLTSINIQSSVTEIEPSSFTFCKSLKSIRLPKGIKKINRMTFEACTALESITLPDSLKDISVYAFNRCSSLKSITLSHSLEGIHQCAFRRCTSLTSITIPNSVTEIGIRAFEDCTSLEEIKYDGTKEDWNNLTLGKGWIKNCPAKITFLR